MYEGIVIINILLILIFFNYVNGLENQNCICSEDWRREFIKYYTGALILRIILFNIINNYKVPILGLIFNTINFFINLLGLVYIWSLYTYSRKLIKESCECSNKKGREIMANYSLVIMSIFLVLLILYLFRLISICS